MEPRLNIITLGAKDWARAVAFYRDGLGWPLSSSSIGDFALFKLSTGTALAIYPRKLLAKDVGLEEGNGFAGITLAHNVASQEEVDRVLARAAEAGGTLIKPAKQAEWGGYSGYFADTEGHPWEVAFNPFIEIVDGNLVVPV